LCLYVSFGRFFNVDFANGIVDGVKVMLALAYKILAQQRRGPAVQMLPAPGDDQMEDDDA
jgi:hypothetical protein